MNVSVYKLPPANVPEVKCELKDLQGYLELEVSLINFITNNKSGKKPENLNNKNKKFVCETNDTPLTNNIINHNNNHNNKNSLSVNENYKELKVSSIQGKGKTKGNCKSIQREEEEDKSVQVKIVWCGERIEDAANIIISCKTQQQQQQLEEYNKLKSKRKYKQYLNRPQRQHQQQQEEQKRKQHKKRQHLLLSANNKLRYRICTNSSLFLEYLRSCKPIDIIVTRANSCLNATQTDNCLTTAPQLAVTAAATKPLGQAKLRLPLALLKKFKHNIVKGQNFDYKTKVYTLYQQQAINPLPEELAKSSLLKTGEIQLRFKMLFAPTAAASATAVANAQHGNVVIHEKTHQLHNNHCHHNHHHHHHHHHRHHHNLGGKNNKVSSNDVQGDIPKRLTSQTKSEEIVEAMKKLDAKLVAYLAGETEITSKLTNCEEENEVNLNLENNNLTNNLADLLPATKLNIFKSISSIKLEMEALTLQPDGTKSIMHLLQNEIDPIITVECQLSNELIKLVPRHDMFHIMQFESEKFHSLTQCTRFGQKAERTVKLDLNEELSDENANERELDFGRIHFTVWWREPGTCLNELLGMGVLELKELYDNSLLEQCKRIEIQRRGKELACLYFKIILQREDNLKTPKRELFLPKQISSDSDSEKTPATTDKNTTKAAGQQQQTTAAATAQSNAANNSNINVANDKGEYADNYLYLKHTKLQ